MKKIVRVSFQIDTDCGASAARSVDNSLLRKMPEVLGDEETQNFFGCLSNLAMIHAMNDLRSRGASDQEISAWFVKWLDQVYDTLDSFQLNKPFTIALSATCLMRRLKKSAKKKNDDFTEKMKENPNSLIEDFKRRLEDQEDGKKSE